VAEIWLVCLPSVRVLRLARKRCRQKGKSFTAAPRPLHPSLPSSATTGGTKDNLGLHDDG
jgi:hypothetical protein